MVRKTGDPAAVRVLLIEDETDLAEAVAVDLRWRGYAVDLAFDGDSGMAAADVVEYDAVLLDLRLPAVDGFTVCRELRAKAIGSPILMLTALDQVADRVRGLDAGADDYIVKPFALEELAARLRALLRRDSHSREPRLRLADLGLDPASQMVWSDRRPLQLTRKEFGILEYMLRRAGMVISAEELLDHVWDDQMNPFTNTIRVHVLSLRRKLAHVGSQVTIRTLIGRGYTLGAPGYDADDSPN